MNCHGCKWLDRYKKDGNGYCCMVVRSKTQTSKVRRPDMAEVEGYDSEGLAEYLLQVLKAHFPIDEMLEDYEISERMLLDEIEYAFDDIGF